MPYKDPEKKREHDKRYREENREKISGGKKKWYEENRDRLREDRKKNREKKREYNKKYREANSRVSSRKVREYNKKYNEENRDKKSVVEARRRARKAAVLTIPFTSEQLAARLSMYPGCWMCGGPKEGSDHVKPLAKGGAHILANLRPACKPCNSKKKDKWPYPR